MVLPTNDNGILSSGQGRYRDNQNRFQQLLPGNASSLFFIYILNRRRKHRFRVKKLTV